MNHSNGSIGRQMPRVLPRKSTWSRSATVASLMATTLSSAVLAAPPAGGGKPCPSNNSTTGTTVSTTTPGIVTGPGGVNVVNNGNGGVVPPNLPATRPTVAIPSVDTAAYDAAKTELSAARLDLTKAIKTQSDIATRITRELEMSQEMKDASIAASAARTKYDAAAAPVLAALIKQPAYQAKQLAATNAEQAVAELASRRDVEPAERMAAAKAALSAKNEVAKLQADALAADPAVVSSKAAWLAASAALGQLRQQNADAVRKDADWLATKEKVDAAKSAVALADQKVADAQKQVAQQQTARATALADQKKLDRQYAQQASRPW